VETFVQVFKRGGEVLSDVGGTFKGIVGNSFFSVIYHGQQMVP
jgi:hypothetical protein